MSKCGLAGSRAPSSDLFPICRQNSQVKWSRLTAIACSLSLCNSASAILGERKGCRKNKRRRRKKKRRRHCSRQRKAHTRIKPQGSLELELSKKKQALLESHCRQAHGKMILAIRIGPVPACLLSPSCRAAVSCISLLLLYAVAVTHTIYVLQNQLSPVDGSHDCNLLLSLFFFLLWRLECVCSSSVVLAHTKGG